MREDNKRLLAAVRAVFVPLASLLIRHGVNVAAVVEQLKIAFVEAARKEHGRVDKPTSINRISQLTGLGRKHVTDLLKMSSETVLVDELISPDEATILSTWSNSAKYLDEVGQPRALELGPGPGTFDALVKQVSGEESSEMYLNRMLQAGSIATQGDDRVMMMQRHFRIADDLPRVLAVGLVPLATTLSKNWGGEPGQGLCQQVSHSTRIDPGKAGTIRRISRERITSFMQDVDDLLTNIESDDDAPLINADGNEIAQLGIGAYYFEIER